MWRMINVMVENCSRLLIYPRYRGYTLYRSTLINILLEVPDTIRMVADHVQTPL